RGRIGDAVAITAEAGRAGDVHDPPAAALDQMRDRELARKKRPDDVDVEDVAEVIRRHILCRRLDRADHTGGVDEDVETTETLDGGAEHRTDVVLLRHVAGCDEGFSLRVLIVEPHGMAFEGLRTATGPPYSSRSGTATPQTPTFVSSNEIAQPLFRISARFSRSSSGSVIVARQSRSSEPVATRPTSSSARKASSAFCEAPACRGRRRPGSTERRSGCELSTRSRQTERLCSTFGTVR